MDLKDSASLYMLSVYFSNELLNLHILRLQFASEELLPCVTSIEIVGKAFPRVRSPKI